MTDLVFARDLPLPRDAATQKFAFLGRSSSGKSYAAKRLVESLVRSGSQVIVLDSVGVWYGLRSGARPLDIPILGGLHGDAPLDSSMGAAIADLACDHATSLVLDVSQMIDADRTRFATAFARRFYERMKGAPRVITLVLEECQEYVPQEPQGGEAMMLHEFQRIAKIGRNFGIGLVLISQRPQEINKKALNQAEVVVAFQMTGPQERKALTYWLSDRGVDAGLPLDKTLPTLEVGKPFIWSPQWLKVSRIVEILPIETGDTSRTPTVGEAAPPPPKLSILDVTSLLSDMQQAVEAAKQDEPKFLKARIQELEKRLAKGAPVPVASPFDRIAAGQLVLKAAFLREQRSKALTDVVAQAQDLGRENARLEAALAQVHSDHESDSLAFELEEFFDGHEQEVIAGPVVRPVAPAPVAATEIPGLPSGEATVLAVVLNARGGATKALVGLETKFKVRTVNDYLARLRVRGLVTRSGDHWFATAQGFNEPRPAPSAPPPPSPLEPRGVSHAGLAEFEPADLALVKLEKVDRLLLRVLGQHGKMPLPRAAMLAGYPSTTSTTRNSATKLRGLGFIEGKSREVAITDAGRAQAGKIEKLPRRGPLLLDYWCDRLERIDGKILRVLVKRHPTRTLQAPLITAAGYEPSKSTGRNSITKLRSLGLVSGKDSEGGVLVRQELVK